MKKIAVYSILSGVLAAGMLTACSTNQTSTQSSTQKSSTLPKVVVVKGPPAIFVDIKGNKLAEVQGIIKAGSVVHFVLNNTDKVAHTFENKELNLSKVVESGKIESFDWTLPKKPGKYVIEFNGKNQKDKLNYILILK